MRPYEDGSTQLSPEAALALQRAMERESINQQGLPVQAQAGGFVGMPDFSQMVGYSGPSAAQMAQSQFAPQFQILQNLVNQTNQRYDTAYSDIGSVYRSLADKIRGQAGDIRSQYDQTGQRIGDAYNQAINSVSGAAQANQAAVAEMLARLGIAGQAAPTALGSMGENLIQNVGVLAQNQSNRLGFNSQQGQNELDYNNRSADTAGLAGSNAQRDISLGKQNALSALDMQRLQLTGQQTAAENQYAQQIAKMQQDAQSSAFDNWYKMQQLGLQRDDNDTSRARLELDTKQFQQSVNQYQQSSQLDQEKALNSSGDAYAILASRAGQMFGPNSSAAASAVEKVMNAYRDAVGGKVDGIAKGTATLGDVQKEVSKYARSTEESLALQGLATLWYQQLGNKQQYGFNY